MTGRFFLILVAVTQIAALPVSIDPPEVEVGTPITISITVTDERTELVGFPDLGAFALLAPPEKTDDTVSLRLLPLRPGKLTLPAFRFRTGQHLKTTEAVTLTVSDTLIPDKPYPLKTFPEAAEDQPKIIQHLGLIIAAGLSGVGLSLSIFLRRRRSVVEPSTPDLDQQLAQLATEVRQCTMSDHPEWPSFIEQLEKVRFAPLSRHPGQLNELTQRFKRLRGDDP